MSPLILRRTASRVAIALLLPPPRLWCALVSPSSSAPAISPALWPRAFRVSAPRLFPRSPRRCRPPIPALLSPPPGRRRPRARSSFPFASPSIAPFYAPSCVASRGRALLPFSPFSPSLSFRLVAPRLAPPLGGFGAPVALLPPLLCLRTGSPPLPYRARFLVPAPLSFSLLAAPLFAPAVCTPPFPLCFSPAPFSLLCPSLTQSFRPLLRCLSSRIRPFFAFRPSAPCFPLFFPSGIRPSASGRPSGPHSCFVGFSAFYAFSVLPSPSLPPSFSRVVLWVSFPFCLRPSPYSVLCPTCRVLRTSPVALRCDLCAAPLCCSQLPAPVPAPACPVPPPLRIFRGSPALTPP